MGTLGCINDMLRRDKENRELRKRNRERINETRDRLLHVKKYQMNQDLTIESLEAAHKEILQKEQEDRNFYLSFFIKFILLCVIILIIGIVIFIW